MQSLKRPGRTAPKRLHAVSEPEPEGVEPGEPYALDADEPHEPHEPHEFGTDELDDVYDALEMYRVICPDCAQSIALLADEEVLPEHALCASPWNPFGLTVCAGTGRPAREARSADESARAREQDTAVLLTLPQGLDWRMQPFSHVGGPGSRPMRVPALRRDAA